MTDFMQTIIEGNLTLHHKSYLKRYVETIGNTPAPAHVNSPYLNRDLADAGYAERGMELVITHAGLKWLGFGDAAAAALLMIQAKQIGDVFPLNDTTWVTLAQRWYIESALWEQRYEVAVRAAK